MTTERAAIDFALKAHGDQRYGDEPYAVHLYAVRQVLQDFGYQTGSWLGIAAWLHDTIEDTATTREDIAVAFGRDIAALVWAVTGIGPTRAARCCNAYAKIQTMSRACNLKLADRIANVEASQKGRPDMLEMYRREQAGFFDALHTMGDPKMWTRLEKALQ